MLNCINFAPSSRHFSAFRCCTVLLFHEFQRLDATQHFIRLNLNFFRLIDSFVNFFIFSIYLSDISSTFGVMVVPFLFKFGLQILVFPVHLRACLATVLIKVSLNVEWSHCWNFYTLFFLYFFYNLTLIESDIIWYLYKIGNQKYSNIIYIIKLQWNIISYSIIKKGIN